MKILIRASAAAILALAAGALSDGRAQAPAQAPSANPAPIAVFKVDTSKTVMTEEPSLPGHTVYYPVKAPKGKMPVVVWGNSGCIKAGNSASPFLGALAASGYFVIASGPIAALEPTRVGVPPRISPVPGAPPPPVDPATGRPRGPTADELTKTSELGDAMTWAEAQSKQKGSAFYGKLDPAHIAVMGTSCGGGQAIEIASDPRVKSMVLISSGLLDRPRVGFTADEATLKKVRVPMLYLSGGSTDAASANARRDFDRVDAVPIFFGDQEGMGHVSVTAENGGAWPPIVAAWLDWQFKGDQKAAKMFKGADCGLCKQPGFTVLKKKID